MYSSARQILLFAALLYTGLWFASCENDINKIKELSKQQSASTVDTTTDVDVVYSDSARVKLHLTAPLLLQHADTSKDTLKTYQEMPHGVKIVFYDTSRREEGSIIADSGIYYTKADIIEFHKNVVAVNVQGDTYRSDELIWDQKKKIIYSNKSVQMISKNGDVMNGVPFTSDEKLTHPHLSNTNGVFHVSDMPDH